MLHLRLGLDPNRKKMSKSLGNVVTPIDLLDPFRFRCRPALGRQSARPGVDLAVDEGQLKVGRRLAIKVLNASQVLPLGPEGRARSPSQPRYAAPLDLALVTRLAGVMDDATAAFDELDYARALERTEAFFWSFCDDYVELVKNRAYSDASVGERRPRRGRRSRSLFRCCCGSSLRSSRS